MKIKHNQTRLFAVTVDDTVRAEDSNHITFLLSSETPVRREYGDEILVHTAAAIDMSRATPNGLPLLVSHNDTQLPIGRLKNLRIENKQLRGDAFFSGRPEAQAVRQDVLDGVVTDLSVGYRIIDYRVEKAATANDVNQVFITRWMPREGSACASGADGTAGFFRAEDQDTEMDLDLERKDKPVDPDLAEETPAEDEAEGGEEAERKDPSTQEADSTAPISDTEEEVNRAIVPPVLDAESQSAEGDPQTIVSPPAEVAAEEAQEEAATIPEMEDEETEEEKALRCAAEQSRSDSELLSQERIALRTVALKMNFRSEAAVDEILATHQDIDAARALLLKPQVITESRKDYTMSFENALLQGLTSAIRGDFASLDETMKGAITQTGARSFKADLFNTMGTRANEMTTSAGGTNTIYEQNIGFLELLRARTAVLKAGGRTRQGIGNLSYMRQKQASTASLRAELGSVANTFADFEKVSYTPKALTAKVILTDELQKESMLDLQNALRNDIVKQFAIAMDQYALVGATGSVAIGGLLSSGSGIYNGNLATAALPTFAQVNALKALVDQTAVDLASCAYLSTPSLLAVLETTSKFAGGIGLPICDGNKVNGYNAFTSTNVPVTMVGTTTPVAHHSLLFGDFSQLEICLQGPTEFDVNTTTYFAEGLTVLSARQYFDIGILHPKAFAACGNFLIA